MNHITELIHLENLQGGGSGIEPMTLWLVEKYADHYTNEAVYNFGIIQYKFSTKNSSKQQLNQDLLHEMHECYPKFKVEVVRIPTWKPLKNIKRFIQDVNPC